MNSNTEIVDPKGERTPIVINVGNLVEFMYWRVIRIGFVTHIYNKKIRVVSEDDLGREVVRVVKKSSVINSHEELPPHIKYFK